MLTSNALLHDLRHAVNSINSEGIVILLYLNDSSLKYSISRLYRTGISFVRTFFETTIVFEGSQYESFYDTKIQAELPVSTPA